MRARRGHRSGAGAGAQLARVERAPDAAANAAGRALTAGIEPPAPASATSGGDVKRLALLLLALAGCAYLPATITMPSRADGTVPAPGGRKLVIVGPFVDQRAERARCGMKKNGSNTQTADVFCAQSPSAFLANRLAEALRAKGYDVRPPGGAGVRIEGTLLQFFSEPKVNFFDVDVETDINVRLSVQSENGLRADREFYVKGVSSTMVMTDDHFQTASNEAIEDVTRVMVTAIDRLLAQYPDAR
jgi:uncharacterized lipoprotein YajG